MISLHAFRPMRAVAATAIALAASAGAARAAGDRELGQYLASECVTCHQATGQQTAGVPAIVGLPHDQFVALMVSYKNRERPNAIMQTIAARLSAEEIEALAAYFAQAGR